MQLVMQLAAPPPYDLSGDDLSEYGGVRPLFNHWRHVAKVCGKLSDRLLAVCVEALRADASQQARQAETKIEAWKAQASGETPPLGKLPGLAR